MNLAIGVFMFRFRAEARVKVIAGDLEGVRGRLT